jgi:DinB family protein
MALDELTGQLNATHARVRELVSGLSPDQLTRRPDPAKWSIAECLAHLNLTASIAQPKIAAAISHGRQANITGTGPFSPGIIGRLLIWIAEPPPKFNLRAPKYISPEIAHGDPAKVVADFQKFQDGWEKLIRDCEGLHQKRIKVPSLFPGMPRLRLAAPIPWLLAHQRRHLAQAEDVKRQITQQFSSAAV